MLSEYVSVSSRFQRSINIDADMDDIDLIRSYICPKSSSDVMVGMARARSQAGDAAFTWTGPYGSGKSSLVVTLSALLGRDQQKRDLAKQTIPLEDLQEIYAGFNLIGGDGWTCVPIVGSKESVEDVLRSKIEKLYGLTKDTRKQSLLDIISEVSEYEDTGMFIVFDEMGKFLEAALDGACDIYFFQQLAELASRSNGKIVILGILHQAFAEYGRRLTRDIRDEWTKIQGRFLDLPLNVAGEEVIELIGKAIHTGLKPKEKSKASIGVSEHVSKWRPTNANLLAESLNQCWPLHPVVGALLGPISRRRFGQNQRSVFGFLNSSEPFGFQDFLRRTDHESGDMYSPSLLWDYLQTNLEPSIMASPDGHRWALAVEALNRTIAYSDDTKSIDMVKCIALMDMFYERSGLVPENTLLEICTSDPGTDIGEVLGKLESWSILIFKKYKNAYSLYEGSDFDIDAAIQFAEEQMPVLDFDKIRKAATFQPVIAKRHYHKTGAIRWMDVDVVPSEQAFDIAKEYRASNGSIGLYMVILGADNDTENILSKLCLDISSLDNNYPVVVSIAKNPNLIRGHAKELQLLEWIRGNDPSLGGDTVARREVESRIVSIRERLDEYLSENLIESEWYSYGAKTTALTFSNLHEKASEIAGSIYCDSPNINSELANRIKPSSNSNAGLKALLKSMVEHRGEPRLGIVGYPAEGGLFDILIKNTAIYDGNKFNVPVEGNDPQNLVPLWQAADDYFYRNNHRPVLLTELYDVWKNPPYGLKDGLLPFFAVAYMLTRLNSYAVYMERMYRPSVDNLLIDVLLKSPKDIALRQMNFSDTGQKILAGICNTLNSLHKPEPLLSETSEPLDIARHLVSSVIDLHPWVLRTRKLSRNSIQVRELIKNASDPNKVLFDDLPHLFKEHEESLNRGDVLPIIIELEDSLKELSTAYDLLLGDLNTELFDELQVDKDSSDSYESINTRATNIMQISGDFKLDAFITRLSTYSGSKEDIEGIAGLATDKPAWQWIDLDVNQAKLGIAELSQKFNNLEIYGHVYNRDNYRNAVAFMVGLNGDTRTYSREFTVSKDQESVIKSIETGIKEAVQNGIYEDPSLIIAALARIGAEVLESMEGDSQEFDKE